ncbi:hypothetical protein C8R45DRAFT_1092404 [Mycena sanguinolenta]|nr:hypothetical protein C8R45DRAFT_1092404 [Mycena sanguinolenta]
MTSRGTDNLRLYLREAKLPQMTNDALAPKMPPPGHKSHQNHLKVHPQEWRRLECIYSLMDQAMAKIVSSWIDAYIPETSLGIEDEDHITGERLTVPYSPIFNIPFRNERRPTDIMRLSPWLDNLPLMTVQRVIHLLFPATRPWGFFLCDENDQDRKLFQYFMWSLPSPEDGVAPQTGNDIGRKSIVVAFQPPWILSEQDLKEFSKCQSFPPFRIPGNAYPTPLESKERLWGKVNTRFRFHPLSSTYYRYGILAFQETRHAWTVAFVTPTFAYDAVCPSVMEWLMFWVASAMRLKGCRGIPKVRGEPAYNPSEIPCTVYDVLSMGDPDSALALLAL